MHRHLSDGGKSSHDGSTTDYNARWGKFVNTYCDPKDNGWFGQGSGLDFACDRDGAGPDVATGALDRSRVNNDISYTTLIETPRTLDIDFSDSDSDPFTDNELTSDEEDVIAMGLNLYGHKTHDLNISFKDIAKNDRAR